MTVPAPRCFKVLILAILILGSVACGTDKTAAPSAARQWANKVKATLDQTTLEQLVSQMPEDIQVQPKRDGENRAFTWAFSDGSQIVATFRPRGGEDSGAGLVLYMVDIKD